MQALSEHFLLESRDDCSIIHLISTDRVNRLTLARVRALTTLLNQFKESASAHQACRPLIITGNDDYFSVGADLNEITMLTGASAFDFAKSGQVLMNLIDRFPAPVYAAISGYCMGGGLDLALACDLRVCAARATFGHRGAALGLITGWGGTQRLSRLLGRATALQVFIQAERLRAMDALNIGLVSEIVANPLIRCLELIAPKKKLD